jgi:hypothetical protein
MADRLKNGRFPPFSAENAREVGWRRSAQPGEETETTGLIAVDRGGWLIFRETAAIIFAENHVAKISQYRQFHQSAPAPR